MGYMNWNQVLAKLISKKFPKGGGEVAEKLWEGVPHSQIKGMNPEILEFIESQAPHESAANASGDTLRKFLKKHGTDLGGE